MVLLNALTYCYGNEQGAVQ